MKGLPNQIDLETAGKILQERFFFRKKFPDRAELVYMGFHLYKVTVDPGNSPCKHEFVMVNVLNGAFVFYSHIPDLKTLDLPQNVLIRVDEEEGKEIAKREYGFHLLHRNLRTKWKARITNIEFEETILYPFWAGYFVHKNHYALEVVDAISGIKQSGSIKNALIDFLENEYDSKSNPKRKLLDTAHSSGR